MEHQLMTADNQVILVKFSDINSETIPAIWIKVGESDWRKVKEITNMLKLVHKVKTTNLEQIQTWLE